MRLGSSVAIAAAWAVLGVTSAWAQVQPDIMPSANPEALSSEDLEKDTPVLFTWSARVDITQTYVFDVQHPPVMETRRDLVEMNTGLNQGTVISGEMNQFEVLPSKMYAKSSSVSGTRSASLVLTVYRRGNRGEDTTKASHAFEVSFDIAGPEAPTITKLIPGERRLQVVWSHREADDVKSFEVRWNPSVSTSLCGVADAGVNDAGGSIDAGTADSGTSSADTIERRWPEEELNIPNTATQIGITSNLQLGVCAEVVVFAYDEAGNRSPSSAPMYATPIEVLDYWDQYLKRAANPDETLTNRGEDGGFCFVATAAHGSYAHPVVQLLRWFRDGVLKRSPLGTALVHAYYTASPPLAAEIAADPQLASWVRVALIPVALAAALWLLAPLAGLIALLWIARRHLGGRAIAGAALVVALLAAPGAEAKPTDQHDRDGIGFGFEFKGGLYLPAMADEETMLSAVVFDEIFAETDPTSRSGKKLPAKAHPLYTIGVDIHLYQGIGGSVGLGGSFGFMQFVGQGLGVSGDSRELFESSDTTVLHIAPLTLVGFYRFELLRDELSIPVVPYLRGGLAYTVWAVTRGDGGLSTGQKDVHTEPNTGIGGKLGLTATGGLGITLDTIDPTSARRLFQSTGIRSTSIFIEYYFAWVDGFGGDGFDFSEDSWNAGLYLEF